MRTFEFERIAGIDEALAAHSQITGGIIWGYVLPVNADIRELDVSFVEDDDRLASAVGAKGIGELGAVGVSAAIANAVFHATGKRIRDLPIGIARLVG